MKVGLVSDTHGVFDQVRWLQRVADFAGGLNITRAFRTA